MIEALQELGYTVILAENGLDCVEIYKNNPGMIDLVILDMIMPVLSGYEAFMQIKEFAPDVKCLLSSGYVSEDEVRTLLDNGAKGFLSKPYGMVQLAKEIRRILDGQ
jgi:CheY-like chemotaxis protein